MQIDIFWFRVINNLAGLNNILDILAIFFATFLLPLLFVLLIPVSFFLKKLPEEKWWELPLKIFASMTLAYVLRIILGKIFFRLRPFVELANVHQLIFVPPSEPSFPSGHAATSFALAFTIFWVDREWGWGFLLMATLISLARIFVGVHYPSDVLAGLLIGLLASWLINYLEQKEWQKIGRALKAK